MTGDKLDASEGLEEASLRFIEDGSLAQEEEGEGFDFFFKKSSFLAATDSSDDEGGASSGDEGEASSDDEGDASSDDEEEASSDGEGVVEDEETLDAEGEDSDEEGEGGMQAVDCKKFFKLKRREILFFMRKFYFGRKVTRSHVHLFLKKLKRKSTLEICNCAANRFIDAASLFFYFFNVSYLNFFIRQGYLYQNFNRIVARPPT
uniref:Uncharacterized mitochondrial protein ORF9 n=1 Tax=Paramecium tetraurelia TaxID=5888 RepID=YM09_PARTE|nr:unnamed protein product [Paramecium aurelia]P15610.2 RecName: Full=Uncharacterized mitochondrial protein ORF9 [Paramecium tetraurelia]CAA34050.1 unnamed protein product [Paramecium aurelia]